MAVFPKLPKFDESKRYLLKGETADLFVESIERRTPIPGEGLLATYTRAGVVLRVSGEGGSSSSSSSSSGSLPPSESSSSSSGSSSDSGSSSASGSSDSGSVSGSSAPPSGSKTAIVNVQGRWIAWYAEERKDSIFGDCQDLPIGVEIELPDEMMESIAPGTLRVVSNEPVDRPGIAHVDVILRAGKTFLKARSWGLFWFSRRPKIVCVSFEGIRAGFENAGWQECSEKVALRNRKWWAQAYELTESDAEET